MQKTQFVNCNLEDADFTETEMQQAMFESCNLKNAIFERTNLEKVNFITSINFSIDPEINRLKGAKFSKEGVVGLLQKYQIVVE